MSTSITLLSGAAVEHPQLALEAKTLQPAVGVGLQCSVTNKAEYKHIGGFLHLKFGLSEALVQNSSFTVTAAPAN